MKVNLIAVGKIKENFYQEAISEYKKRLSRFVDLQVVECSEFPPKSQENTEIELSKNREGKKIIEKAKGFIIATAIDGNLVSSEGLANLFSQKMNEGFSEISLIIGGSNGISDEVLLKADCVISFGKVTFPHQLMRVILIEQIYRAFSIINKLPYHK
ncbi:MAG: 23S rRNA (pseudouridine(1915)-N(3))-methyltransferase RlmH [Clostridia bacterium]